MLILACIQHLARLNGALYASRKYQLSPHLASAMWLIQMTPDAIANCESGAAARRGARLIPTSRSAGSSEAPRLYPRSGTPPFLRRPVCARRQPRRNSASAVGKMYTDLSTGNVPAVRHWLMNNRLRQEDVPAKCEPLNGSARRRMLGQCHLFICDP